MAIQGSDRRDDALRSKLQILLCLLLSLGVAPLRAHIVSQLYGEIRESGESWEMEILFDAGFADPATRNDPSSPQPTRDWLLALPLAGQTRLAEEAHRYLKDIISMQSHGKELEWVASFPDFETKPPKFPSLLNDGAYFHVRIVPAKRIAGEMEIHLAAGKHPDLVMKLPSRGNEAAYVTVEPGGMALLKKEHGPEQVGRHAAVVAFEQGVLHVVPRGLDHILFVLGIFLLQRRWQPLLKQSLAFTAAHTLTLGLAAAGWVKIPGAIVEPIIALSITALAVENLFVRELKPWRLWLVFGFGLVHGLGFAGVLSTWIQPGQQFFPTLIAANLGVELGQLVVLGIAWALTLHWHASRAWEPARSAFCIAIALSGLWWCAERSGLLAGFGG